MRVRRQMNWSLLKIINVANNGMGQCRLSELITIKTRQTCVSSRSRMYCNKIINIYVFVDSFSVPILFTFGRLRLLCARVWWIQRRKKHGKRIKLNIYSRLSSGNTSIGIISYGFPLPLFLFIQQTHWRSHTRSRPIPSFEISINRFSSLLLFPLSV